MHIEIRSAETHDSGILTDISHKSKMYWEYPPDYFAVWEKELTITAGYIEGNTVFIAEADGIPVAYYALVHVEEDFISDKVLVKSGWWLEHMFVLPEWIGKGVGRRMTGHLFCVCEQRGIKKLHLFADPNAKGFYEKTGFRYVSQYPSNIEGRTVCLFEKTFWRAEWFGRMISAVRLILRAQTDKIKGGDVKVYLRCYCKPLYRECE